MSLLQFAIDTFNRAADLNLEDPIREGSLLCFANYGQVVMTGDMHGHRRNFEKLVKYCQLESTPVRHVILHELIHEEPASYGAADRSVELLLDAAKWKTFFPTRFTFFRATTSWPSFRTTRSARAGGSSPRISTAAWRKCSSRPAWIRPWRRSIASSARFRWPAGRPTGSSLPIRSPTYRSSTNTIRAASISAETLSTYPREVRLTNSSGAGVTPRVIEKLSAAYDVDFFVIGHQPQEYGYDVVLEQVVILASDNNHGVFLPIDCHKRYNIDSLVERIKPFAGVA